MSTPAVTPDAPAASPSPQVEQASDHSVFLPQGEHYQKTGEIAPEPKHRTSKSAVTEEAPAASDSETAAASEAASEQHQDESRPAARTKTPQSSENRFQKLSRENRELREKLARAEGVAEGRQPAEKREQQESQSASADATAKAAPKPQPKPKIDDVDKDGKAKYKTFAEYEDAKDDWLRKETLREFQESQSKTETERTQRTQQEAVARDFGAKVVKAREKYADFDQVAFPKDAQGKDTLHIPQGSVPDQFILQSPVGTDILYSLGKGSPIVETVRDAKGNLHYKMTPLEQAKELTKLEIKLSGRPKPAAEAREEDLEEDAENSGAARPITQAPRPPHQTSGKGAVQKDAVASAVEEGDMETYRREQNARELQRRKKGK